jgi:hypothetical protein
MEIEIDNKFFKYEDEELDEIEYLEIVSLDELIKDNPSFIAMSREDIYENLYELFSDKKRSLSVTQLFYDFLDNKNEREGKLKDYSNYAFNVDAEKDNYAYDLIEKKKDARNFEKLTRLNTTRYDEAKNRYFFSIKYNTESTHIKFKPSSKINTVLLPDNKDYPVYYPVFPIDDVNIPLIAAYYKIPTVTVNDYIYSKIASHLMNSKNINFVSSENISTPENLVKRVRPKIEDIIKYLTDCFAVDYTNLDNTFKKFGHSFDFINKSDFDELCKYMVSITENEKERKNITRPFKIKKADIINKRLTFFDKLSSSIKLIKLSDNTIDFLQKLKDTLDDYRLNNVITEQLIPIKNLNIYDIIYKINSDDIDNANSNEFLENIRASIKDINVNECIESIEDILDTYENMEGIVDEHEYMKALFEYSREHIFDYDKDGSHYILSYREAKEIKEGGDIENYEGVLEIQNVNDVMDIEDMDNIVSELNNEIYRNNKKDFDKYLLNINYKNEEGFIESLNIILNMLGDISKSASIDIDYDLMCSELFKYHRTIPLRFDIYSQAFQDAGIDIAANYIHDITKMKPRVIVEGNMGIDEKIYKIISDTNEDWIYSFHQMFFSAITFWIVNVQEKILDNTILIDENYLNSAFIDKWFLYGSPLTGLDKNSKNGVFPYISEIVIEYFKDINDYVIDNKNFFDNIKINIDTKYTDILDKLRKKFDVTKEKKKIERGLKEQANLLKSYKEGNKEKLEKDFINALIYMPGVNFKKIHKYLVGCCLKKIDDSFDSDVDLVKAGRKDLIAIKNFYSNNRVTNISRLLRYIPTVKPDKLKKKDKKDAKGAKEKKGMKDAKGNDSDTSEGDEEFQNGEHEKDYDNIQFIKIDDYIHSIKNDENIVSDWLDKMYNKNILLPNNIIDDMKNNSKNIDIKIKENVNILIKTSRNNSDFNNYFIVGKINARSVRSILLSIAKILYSCKIHEDDNVNTLVNTSINAIKSILKDIYKLNKVLNDDVIIDIERINAYIVSRALCLPFSPENIENGYLTSIIDVPRGFIETNAKKIYNDVLNILKSSIFPTMEENIDFINKKREENKQKKLSILNNKTVEENQLITNLKKAGIKNKLMEVGAGIDEGEEGGDEDDGDEGDEGDEGGNGSGEEGVELFNNVYSNNNDYDNDVKDVDGNEHRMYSVDEEGDDENMETRDFGFIYS